MFCSTCKLHYPDHLNFCKQCGRPLDRSVEEAMPTRCCTRCGSRVIAGENFCQQCGARLNVRSEDTTIGACFNCGSPWRSAWLFCRSCGLDREGALQLSPAPPLSEQVVPTLTAMEAVSIKPSVEPALSCPSCGAEALPYAQFCEICGHLLSGATADSISAVAPPFAGPSDEEASTLDRPLVEATEIAPPPKVEEEIEEIGVVDQIDRIGVADQDEERRPYDRVLKWTGRLRASDPEQTELEVTAPTLIDLPPESDAAVEATLLEGASPARGEGRTTSGIGAPKATTQIRPSTEPTVEMAEVRPTSDISHLRPTIGVRRITLPDEDELPDSPAPVAITAPPPLSRRALLIFGVMGLLAVILGVLAWRAAFSRRDDEGAAQPSPQTTAQTAPGARSTGSAIAPPDGMVYVPGGTFRPGRDGGDEYEEPGAPVTLAPYFIDRTEVTNEQYRQFVAATGHAAPPDWSDGRYNDGAGNLPVVNVTWEDATAYARWAGKRLPTEAEWEFAARGADGRLYPWGPRWQAGVANTKEANRDRIVAVGSFTAGASPFGALDLVGNVWEWTADELRSYSESDRTLAPGKVIRGGAYDVSRDRATSTYRGVVQPEKAYDKTGFRCARDAR